MNPRIEILITKKGTVTITAPGFVGTQCEAATGLFKHLVAQGTIERTGAFYQEPPEENRVKIQQSEE